MKEFRVKGAMRFAGKDQIYEGPVKSISHPESTDKIGEDTAFNFCDAIDVAELFGHSLHKIELE